MGETQEPGQTENVRRLWMAERQRADFLLSEIASALARIEQQLTTISAAPPPGVTASFASWLMTMLGSLTMAQWLKLLSSIALPLAVLLLTGNVELARKLMVP